jgi:hypothetical protein
MSIVLFLRFNAPATFWLFTFEKSFHIGYRSTGTPSTNEQKRGLTMLKTSETTKATTAAEATKDSGRVHIGGGAIHFADPTPARETTKDAGRVHIGGGAIHF